MSEWHRLTQRDELPGDRGQLEVLYNECNVGREPSTGQSGQRSIVLLDGSTIVAHIVGAKTGTDTAELEWAADPDHRVEAVAAARRLATNELGRRCRADRLPGDAERERSYRGFPWRNDERLLLAENRRVRLCWRIIAGHMVQELSVPPADKTADTLLYVPGLHLGVSAAVELVRQASERGEGCRVIGMFDGSDPLPIGDPYHVAVPVIEAWLRDARKEATARPTLILHSMWAPAWCQLAVLDLADVELDAPAFKLTRRVRFLSGLVSTIVLSVLAVIAPSALRWAAGWVFGWTNLGVKPNRAQRRLFAAPFAGSRLALRSLWVGNAVASVLRWRGPVALAQLADAQRNSTAWVYSHDHVAAHWTANSENVAVVECAGGHTESVGAARTWARTLAAGE